MAPTMAPMNPANLQPFRIALPIFTHCCLPFFSASFSAFSFQY